MCCKRSPDIWASYKHKHIQNLGKRRSRNVIELQYSLTCLLQYLHHLCVHMNMHFYSPASFWLCRFLTRFLICRLCMDTRDVWQGRNLYATYVSHPHEFFLVTSETRESFEEMATSLRNLDIFRCRGLLTLENKLLMLLMWLRTYPCYTTLSLMFDLPKTTVARIINSMLQPLHTLYAGSTQHHTASIDL